MSFDGEQPRRRVPVIGLALAGLALIAIVVLVLHDLDWRLLVDQGMAIIRAAGPWVFFTAMAILPAFGMPLGLFTIPAGEAFGTQMGLGNVIVVSMTMIAVNLALGYWVARYLFRPVLIVIFARYGYQVPRVTPENALQIALVVRLTPGPPYAVQTGILGVAELPFRLFMIVSWLSLLPWVVGAISLGQGLFNGN